MIASTGFAAVFLLAVIAKDSTADPSSVKKVLTKPVHRSPPAEMQNFVPKLTVSVYYSSMSSESVDLFKNQIGPNLAKFQKYVNFDFVPSGNTETKLFDGRWFFICQNGPSECRNNKWQACSIQVLISEMRSLAKYLVCNMNSPEDVQSGYQCTRKLGLYAGYYGRIKKCFMDREFSDSLMVHHSHRTRVVSPQLTMRMPSVAFNGIYNASEQDDIRKDLGRAVCRHLHPKPTDICL